MLDHTTISTIFIEDMTVGQMRAMEKTITDRDIELFAQVSCDHNPVHLDAEYAQETVFKGRIAHGMLTAALISAVVGEQLPGHGTVYLRQNMAFLAPVRPGDTVRAEVEVLDIDRKRNRVTLATRCLVGETLVLRGDALVLAPSRAT